MVASDLVAAVGAVPVRGCLRNLLVQGCGRSALSLFEGWRLEATVQRSDCRFSALRGFSRSWPQEESRPPQKHVIGFWPSHDHAADAHMSLCYRLLFVSSDPASPTSNRSVA
ncbi:hypothetical protein IG631_08025 [Alternaria alternata]|nr:hypothetical protein IG631_08025 [Alternaria alternata]